MYAVTASLVPRHKLRVGMGKVNGWLGMGERVISAKGWSMDGACESRVSA